MGHAGSTAGTGVCMSIHLGIRSWILLLLQRHLCPWDGCQIIVVEGDVLVRDILFGHLGNVTLHILHLNKH